MGAGSFLQALSLSSLTASWKTLLLLFSEPPKEGLEDSERAAGGCDSEAGPLGPQEQTHCPG